MKKLIATLMTAATLTFGVSATTFAAPQATTATTATVAYINTQVNKLLYKILLTNKQKL